MKKYRLIATGKVQGVGFRYATYALALEIGDLCGRVWNKEDGSVEILVQSPDSQKLNRFIQRIRKGPSRWARVDYLSVEMAAFPDFNDFKMTN